MKQLDELYKACLSRGKIGKQFVINPSMVSLHTVSPFNLWCDLFAPKEEKDPEPESLKILAKIGNIEEENYVAEKYPGMQRIEVETLEQGFFQVLKGCFEGVKAFHLAPLIYLPDGMLGIPDLLEKKAGHTSVFGSYHYVIKEKKTTKEPKDKHILQTAFSNYVLGKVQGYRPPTFIILNRDNEESEFAADSYTSGVEDSIVKIREIMNGKFITPTKGALLEPWKSFGLKKAREIGDISLVSGIGPTKKELLSRAGIRTISALKKADISALKIKGIGTDTLAKWQIHAGAISQNKIIRIKRPGLAKCNTEIFLDLEGTFDVSNLFLEDLGIETDARWMNAVYLIGVMVRQNGRQQYTPYFADTIDKEKEILERSIGALQSNPGCPIYHYGPYEKTQMKRMLETYSMTDYLTDRMVDLNQILKHSAVFPTYGFGLKEIAKELGFEWSEQGMDGFISIARYLNYLRNRDEAEIAKIVKYNEEDCRATAIVKDFLDSLSR